MSDPFKNWDDMYISSLFAVNAKGKKAYQKIDWVFNAMLAIHNAIETKGVNVPDTTPFLLYADKILEISGGAPPDPAVICPAAGYILPADCPNPDIFSPNPKWPPIPAPSADHITLLMSDKQDGRIVFSATISSAGTYTVDVYGAAGALLNSQVKANNATYDYSVTPGAGYPATGYTTFKVDIYPTSGANHLTGFRVKTVSNYSITNWQILYAAVNIPNVTDLASAFSGIDALQSIDFISAMDSLTTLSQFNLNGLSLKSIVLPSMNALQTMIQCFSGCVNLKVASLPAALPTLTNLSFTFYNCSGLKSITYPGNLPALTTFGSCHYQNTALVTCNLPTTIHVLADMANTFYGCKLLPSIIMPADLHHLTSLNATFRGCYMLQSVTMPTVLSILTNLSQTFMDCHMLPSLTLPAAISTVNTCASMCQGCWSLQTITNLEFTSNVSYNGTFTFCSMLTSLQITGTAALVNDMTSMFNGCLKITSIILPATMNAVLTFASGFSNCMLMTTCTMPTSMSGCTNMSALFNNCASIVVVTLPATLTALQNLTSCFYSCSALTTINLPANLPAINNIGTFASVANPLLTTISVPAFGTVQADAIAIIKGNSETAFNWPTLRVTRISIVALSPAAGNALTSIDVNWAASLYAGAAPQILFTYQNISAAEINRIFTALPAVTAKTINVRNCTGAATCTPAIATAKGWTVLNI
jgi:hypothetical protein